MTTTRLLAAMSLCAAVSTPTFAQQQPLPAPAVPDDAVPKHACTKPGDYPGSLASDNQRKNWQKEVTGYSECLKRFINEQRALAEPHVKASNAAIDEYNIAAKTFNEQIEKTRDPAK